MLLQLTRWQYACRCVASRRTDVGLMPAQRRRQWAGINPTLIQRLVFAVFFRPSLTRWFTRVLVFSVRFTKCSENKWWPSVWPLASPASLAMVTVPSEQSLDMNPILTQRWATVCDAGATLNQHWFSVSCLLRSGHLLLNDLCRRQDLCQKTERRMYMPVNKQRWQFVRYWINIPESMTSFKPISNNFCYH